MLRRMTILLLVPVASALSRGSYSRAAQTIGIRFDASDPRIAFAAGEIQRALRDAGHHVAGTGADVRIVFDFFQNGMGPQAFRIRKEGDHTIRVVGGDSCGAIYGGLELAEMIDLGGGLDGVEEKARKPYVFRRGLKFNIPFDARAPSYDGTGPAA